MCYLLRVHGILFQSKFILFCMFKKKKKKKKKEEGKKKIHDLKKNYEKKRMIGLKV